MAGGGNPSLAVLRDILRNPARIQKIEVANLTRSVKRNGRMVVTPSGEQVVTIRLHPPVHGVTVQKKTTGKPAPVVPFERPVKP